MKETNIENFDGYIVHSYHVECPYKKKSEKRQKNTVLRHFAFAALAPIAMLADTVVSFFK